MNGERVEAQRALRQARSNAEILEMRRQVLLGDREREMNAMMGRGRGVRPISVQPIPSTSARLVLSEPDWGQVARQRRLARRNQAKKEKMEREEHLRRILREFPYSQRLNFGSPVSPALFLEARRSALNELNRTVREVAHHPALVPGWR